MMNLKFNDNTDKKFICVQGGYEPVKRKNINTLFNKLEKWGEKQKHTK